VSDKEKKKYEKMEAPAHYTHCIRPGGKASEKELQAHVLIKDYYYQNTRSTRTA
jgi:hypothetical protein